MFKLLLRSFIGIILFCLCFSTGIAQTTVQISDKVNQHIFEYKQIVYFEDTTGKLGLDGIREAYLAGKFAVNHEPTPVTHHNNSAYWYRIKIGKANATGNNWILEFFDQTIDSITVYSPVKNTYRATSLGSSRPFAARFYKHKNFSFNINSSQGPDDVYYIRIRSGHSVNVIMVLRTVSRFIGYALDEYFFFGVFYGMILVFGLYNFMMFIAMRQVQYLYYIIYNLSIGLYEMCADGIAYQYIWPNYPGWNNYAYGIALFSASIFAILFAQSLLNLKVNAPRLNKVIKWVIIFRCIYFLACIAINMAWFNYKIIEFLPLCISFYAGCYVLIKGYKPARFFVIGYTFLLTGFVIKSCIALNIWWLPVTEFDYYSLSICFIMEMLFISFAIGDKVRILKKEKDVAQQDIIAQMKQNEELKDTLNRSLEAQVQERTRELVEKSSMIAEQNEELKSVNELLQQQAEEISRMNVLLEKDNIILHNDIEKVTHDRVMLTEVDFEEFSRIYPDRETCFKFLSDLKWEHGYACRKCSNTHYGSGHLPYSRRCSKCGYEESVIAYTILQNTRIPINKAFYMIFLMYSTKGKISSHKLSEILSIRQSTCWAYSSRIKKVMEQRKKEIKNAGNKGWSKLVIDMNA
ncbi:chromosome partitioning protein ParA [Mucilaginibacter rubeus]|uniref:Chromosome partitioning protein ParA n=1 Tax=Mucilaginibacter rubeus TaxID=2027860 RepID=A0AAE6JL83_9SPHI|nr:MULTISPECIES: 7TM diverse intracellular signaling domain-containing protein [Mucilaginibacter]QEM06855.1 chromosome partitioning protein ParA [Mucilaginibacter rubeus]QEM19444.1 chromosome partitioning protein ParA [Mucilaginibacter gossypii]QTE44009.1 chromosome partitioning protein ParA [Mucilaginibacter rubeus]QTE50610.1 chromosome partitioning protein ParA [Mucilaginibacter rubeus]QTE55695.1 chromosome partitioning protein ParA [Mucilaginibacter rubeus]